MPNGYVKHPRFPALRELDHAGDLERATEFIFSHGLLSKQDNPGDSDEVNPSQFLYDLNRGRLDSFKDSFVLYWKGVFCGQSANADQLYHTAASYYGSSNLTVFDVSNPRKRVSIEDPVKSRTPDRKV